MNLVKTSLLNGIAVAIKMLTLLGLNKLLAVYVGPGGYAAIGQFQNVVQMLTTFASGAINNGVTKYTAEYSGDEYRLHALWRTSGTIVLVGATIASLLIALLSKELALWVLGDAEFSGVFLCFAATLIFFSFNTLLLAVLNGRKEIVLYVFANIGGSLFSLIVTSIMAIYFGLYGALVALAVYQSLSFLVTVVLCRKTVWFKVGLFFGAVDRAVALRLAKFTAMALTSAICMPISTILIRNDIVSMLGWDAAGYWEAMLRLSAAYLLLVTTTLAVYYLPRLSELRTAKELIFEIKQGYKIILPVAVLAGVAMYVARDLIIFLLFTTDFSPVRELFAWQMVGDTLKIGSWILAYLLLGKAMYKTYIVTEIVFSASYVLFAWFFVRQVGLEGVVMAYALNYALYWFVMIACVAGYFRMMRSSSSSAVE
ncbi:O-antigen translocase [Pseudomonas proteolytica]|uniref:Oligosaccharide flippase family protein n=1 Tax=Pseudomonas proteolytica TaxID=219574 RepID=A0AAW5AJ36_9PSED|nr:O-antigen translocase [Pseudomonas proteolytica]KAA8705841.1 O-antigen translocase [Pseudomonas proteolytica]MCF5061214.1 oligosaccharide flippase family protein [Pseudomonas proteolytica]MCF5104904.1 oligosaccharide flippase family protein [Pseudomonas proteolytica]TWR83555.1 O-antigen translocase [Pseudomonas proteolytica]SEE07780.1 polysaccharide transporter, PST family [Pseudomonas proteolytica]